MTGTGLAFLVLNQRDGLEQLVQRTEAAGKSHQGFGAHHEMHFAQRKVVELETQAGRDVGVGRFFPGERNRQAHAAAARFVHAPVGGFHDARTATGADKQLFAGGRSAQWRATNPPKARAAS